MGRDHGKVTCHQQELYFFFRKTTGESEEEAELAPSLPLTLWESEVLCRFHSTLGQARNHSPVLKPPILQAIDNLEQEITVTHTLTLLSSHTTLTRMGDEKSPEHGDGPSTQICTKSHTLDDHRSGNGMLHFKIFKRRLFFQEALCHVLRTSCTQA